MTGVKMTTNGVISRPSTITQNQRIIIIIISVKKWWPAFHLVVFPYQSITLMFDPLQNTTGRITIKLKLLVYYYQDQFCNIIVVDLLLHLHHNHNIHHTPEQRLRSHHHHHHHKLILVLHHCQEDEDHRSSRLRDRYHTFLRINLRHLLTRLLERKVILFVGRMVGAIILILWDLRITLVIVLVLRLTPRVFHWLKRYQAIAITAINRTNHHQWNKKLRYISKQNQHEHKVLQNSHSTKDLETSLKWLHWHGIKSVKEYTSTNLLTCSLQEYRCVSLICRNV